MCVRKLTAPYYLYRHSICFPQAAIIIDPSLKVARPNETVSFICSVQADSEDSSDTSCDLMVHVVIDNQDTPPNLTPCDTCCGYIISLVAKSNSTVIYCGDRYVPVRAMAYLYVAGNV